MCVSVCVCTCVSTHYIVLHTPPPPSPLLTVHRPGIPAHPPLLSHLCTAFFFLVCLFFVLFLSFHRLNMRHKKTKKATPIWPKKKQQSATKNLPVGQLSACEELPSRHQPCFPFFHSSVLRHLKTLSQSTPPFRLKEREKGVWEGVFHMDAGQKGHLPQKKGAPTLLQMQHHHGRYLRLKANHDLELNKAIAQHTHTSPPHPRLWR